MPKSAQDPKQQTSGEEVRIGVYTCYCGGNISDVVNCEKVAKVLSKEPNVYVSRTNMSMCSDAGQAMIEEDIAEFGLNRIVVGACAPSLHEQTFRGTVTRAGLNPYLYHHVGLREQDSWVHHHDKEGATRKAIRLMAAGIAKARLLEPLDSIRLSAEQHALVIGGGVAGLRAAWDIARRGIQVTLIEKSPFLGGRMAQLESTFPTGKPAREALHQLIDQVVKHPNITILTQAELINMSGYVGNYQAQIRQRSRGVTDDIADAAMQACEATVADEFNFGLTERKLIYRAYEGCYPSTPAIDWDHCPEGRMTLTINGQERVFEDQPKTFDMHFGAVVVATGFDLYEPHVGEYGFGEHERVITLPAFIRAMALDAHAQEMEWLGKPVRSIAFIHCVGSRQIDGVNQPQPDGQVNNYCSRVCCTATLHAIHDLKARYPHLDIYDFYEDIRTYGRGHEEYYTGVAADQVRFLRFHDDELPQVEKAAEAEVHPLIVKVNDYLTWGEPLEVPVDLVVLAVGIMPRGIEELVSMLKISQGTDRFLLEVHPKLRPVETAVPGIVLAGSAQGPMNIQESVAAASAAAAKVSILLGQGQVELEPFVARVDLARCDGTGVCVEVCQYEDAIALETMTIKGKQVQKAVITPANCVGCGVCVGACPNQALDVQGWTVGQYKAMVDAIALEPMAVGD